MGLITGLLLLQISRSCFEEVKSKLEEDGLLPHYSMDVKGEVSIKFGNVILVPEDLGFTHKSLSPKKE
jgi:hypothetical protein